MLLIIDKKMIGNNLMRTFDLDDNEKWQKSNSLDNLAIFVNTKVLECSFQYSLNYKGMIKISRML